MAIPVEIEVLLPWERVPEEAFGWEWELRRELPSGHALSGLKVRDVAHRVDCDDVLFEVIGGEQPLAVVHLTWQIETDPRCPDITWFRDWQHWAEEEMLPAAREYAWTPESITPQVTGVPLQRERSVLARFYQAVHALRFWVDKKMKR